MEVVPAIDSAYSRPSTTHPAWAREDSREGETRTLVLEVEDHAPLHAVLDQAHERAREPAPVREPARTLPGALPDEAELRERRAVVREAVDELEEHGRRRVEEGVQEGLAFALARPGRVRVRLVLREDGRERREPVE